MSLHPAPQESTKTDSISDVAVHQDHRHAHLRRELKLYGTEHCKAQRARESLRPQARHARQPLNALLSGLSETLGHECSPNAPPEPRRVSCKMTDMPKV